MAFLVRIVAFLLLTLVISSDARADSLDQFVQAQMRQDNIHGLSLAIIDNGKIIWAQGYGVRDAGTGKSVTATTLFQAGSISKSVAALDALHLVDQGKLSLDADANSELRSWKIPRNSFTDHHNVTLRLLLSHQAGVNIYGFSGYPRSIVAPSVVQVLNGNPPANSPPIRVESVPGSKWNYSGGGYVIILQLILDATHQPFVTYMRNAVLTPLGMSHSTFGQQLPPGWIDRAATGYFMDGTAVDKKWHVYPESTAAGLWTTPSDLARFMIGVRSAYLGTSNSVISQDLARQMLTDQGSGYGLGVFVKGAHPNLWFMHDGRNAGFNADYVCNADTGQGAVVMINSNDDSGTVSRIIQEIGHEEHWAGY